MFSQGNFVKTLFRDPYYSEFRLSKIEGQLKGGAAPAAAPAAAAEDDDDVDLFASDDEVDEEAERIKVKIIHFYTGL